MQQVAGPTSHAPGREGGGGTALRGSERSSRDTRESGGGNGFPHGKPGQSPSPSRNEFGSAALGPAVGAGGSASAGKLLLAWEKHRV